MTEGVQEELLWVMNSTTQKAFVFGEDQLFSNNKLGLFRKNDTVARFIPWFIHHFPYTDKDNVKESFWSYLSPHFQTHM